MKKYRFCFLLTMNAGNKTRYANLKRVADRESDIEFTWVPLEGYPPLEVAQKLRFFSNVWLSRLWTVRMLAPAFKRLGEFDAVMVHQFEAETLLVVVGYFRRMPLVISSTDEAPVVEESTYPLYEAQIAKTAWRRSLRLKLDRWRVRRIDFFIPFTRWTANILADKCGVPADRILPIHVGLDLGVWSRSARNVPRTVGKFKVLFVGGEFTRKGGDLLLAVFQAHFRDIAELHIVSGEAPAWASAPVYVHKGMKPNSIELLNLYDSCDVLAMPTTADLVPWTYLEAMAMELPCIGTSVGAITEVIEDGVTGFIVPPNDESALHAALLQLCHDGDLRHRMGRAGREKVERDYDSAKNVPRMLDRMRAMVDARRTASAAR